jgi:hypothetical protein
MMNEIANMERPDDDPYALYTLTLPCAYCGEHTTLRSNDHQHVVAVLTGGRLCDACYQLGP